MNEANGKKRLIRTREGRLVAGVCSGIGEYAGIDPTVVRLDLADEPDWEEMAEVIYEGYCLLAPKTLVKRWEESLDVSKGI